MELITTLAKAAALRRAGKSQHQIAKVMGVSRGHVCKMLREVRDCPPGLQASLDRLVALENSHGSR